MEKERNENARKPKKPKDETIVNDIVHGIIRLPDHILKIIDTPQFQRLRYIRQLGVGYFVYPTAGYSRFEHSIGTYYLASELIRQLQSQNINGEPIDISDNDVKCVEIAALCHDLGHGPYSHVWEHAFDDPSIPTRKHEKLSVDIFKTLMKSMKTNDSALKNLDEEMIGNIILGKSAGEQKKRMFLYEIVANKSSGLDVDKFDYLCRDSIYYGWSNKNKIHDIKRIFQFLRIAKDEETGNLHLAMRDREIFHIHDIFYYRHLLHRYGYQHKTVKAIECMFKEALSKIADEEESRNELMKSVIGPEVICTPEIWFSKEFISKVCDYHIWNIMSKYTKEIVGKIHERNLYKLFAKIRITVKDNTKDVYEDIHEFEAKCKRAFPNLLVKFVISSFSLQSENKGNPLLSVNFYKKSNSGVCFKLDEESLPDLVKLVSDEMVLMIFTETKPEGKIKEELENIKTYLCKETSGTFEESKLKTNLFEETFEKFKLKNEIEDLRKRYTFKERLY